MKGRTDSETSAVTLRAFFAVELCAAARASAADVASALRSREHGDGIRWVKPENFHVTLRFLGQVPQERVPSVARCAAYAIAAGEQGPFELRLGELDALPSRSRPQVVVLDVTPSEPLQTLARSLERSLDEAALATPRRRETRPLRPHVTLGRVRRNRRSPSLDPPRPVDPAPTRVEEIVLFQSELGSSGARYTQLERIPLTSRQISIH